jgi:membrane associated rhomboid family serine protease
MYGNRSIWDEIKWQYQTGGILIKLIFINIGLYVVGLTFWLIGWAAASKVNYPELFIREWLYVPSNLKEFAFKAYTLFTYQFLHAGFWHILFNMLVLFWFGRIFTNFVSEKKLLPLYLMGGVAGALLYLVLYNLLPVFDGQTGRLVGASASIMAILGAATALAPDYEVRLYFLFTVKLKFIAALLIVANIFTMPNGNAGGNMAHLGGVAFGFFYIYMLRKGTDLAAPVNRFFDTVTGWFEKKPIPATKFKKVYRNTEPAKSVSVKDGNTIDQAKVDAILDKIAQNGYDSLTKAEKDYLFKASKD